MVKTKSLKIQEIVNQTYNKIAQEYTKRYASDEFDNQYVDIFLNHLPTKAKIIDAGSGPGHLTMYMHKQGHKVEGIDTSVTMLTIAKKKYPKLTFKLMDMTQLKYTSKSIDGILAAYSLIHIPTKSLVKTLSSFNQALKDKGHLMIMAQKGKADRFVTVPLFPQKKTFMNFFTKSRLTKLLNQTGFKVIYWKEIDSTDDLACEGTKAIIYCLARKVT